MQLLDIKDVNESTPTLSLMDVKDVEPLEKPLIEETSLWGAIKTVPAGAAANVVEAGAGVADIFGATDTANRLRRDVGVVRKQIQAEEPVDPMSWKGAVRSAGESMYGQIPLMLAGGGSVALPLLGMSAQAGLQKMSDLTAAGIPYTKALPLAGLSGAIEGITEKIPFTSFLKILKGNKGVASNLVKMMLSEQLGEQAATLGDIVIDQVKPDETWDWQKYKDAIIQTAKATTVQTVAMGGLGVGVNRLTRRKEQPPVVQPPPTVVDALPPLPATASLRERTKYARDLKVLAGQQEKVKIFGDNKLAENKETDTGNMIIEDDEAPIVLKGYTPEQMDRLDKIIESKGSIAEVDKIYKGKSKVDIYARERARELFATPTTVDKLAEEAMAARPEPGYKVVTEPPSARKSDEAVVEEPELTQEELFQLNKRGFPVLADTPTPSSTELEAMTAEQLEVAQTPVKKVIKTKTPAQWREILASKEEVVATSIPPEQAARLADIQGKVDGQAGRRELANRMYLKQDHGYDDARLDAMSVKDIENRVSELRPAEVVSEEKIAKLTEVEQATRDLLAETQGKPVAEWTPEQLDRLEKIQLDAGELDIAEVRPGLNVFELGEVLTMEDGETMILSKVPYETVARQARILTDIRIDRAISKGQRAKKKGGLRDRVLTRAAEKSIEDESVEAAPAEFDEEKFNREYPEELPPEGQEEDIDAETRREQEYLDRAGEKKKKSHKELSAEAKARFDKTMSQIQAFGNYRVARDTIVQGYKYMAENLTKAKDHLAMLVRAEQMAEPHIASKRPAFDAKVIAKAVREGVITKPQAKYVETILKTLKQQPDFKLEFDAAIDQLGIYELADNLMTLKNPKATAHEVMHWAFYNVLTGQERIAYYKEYMNQFYNQETGKKKFLKILAATSSPFNASKNPSEMFASRGSDVANGYKLTAVERSLFTKTIAWFRGLIGRLTRFGGVKLDAIDAIYNKVMDDSARLPELATLDNLADNRPLRPAEAEMDMTGLFSLSNKISEYLQVHRMARANKGTEILAQVQGTDTTRIIAARNQRSLGQRVNEQLGAYFRSPEEFARGTINEPHSYNLNRAEQYIASEFDTHQVAIRDAMMGLSKEEQINIRQVMEGKMVGSAKEQASATKVRAWLDHMKAKYKKFLLKEYLKNLSNRDFNAVADMISGLTEEQVSAKYPRLDSKTVAEIAKNYKEIDTWGLDNYLPNVEKGRFKIVTTTIGVDGKAHQKLVAIGLSERDAVRKATKYLQAHPESNSLWIDTDFKSLLDDKTAVSSKQYGYMVSKLAKEIKESIAGIETKVAKAMAKKTLGRKFSIKPTHAFSEYTLERKDVLQGEENIFPVLESYAYSLEKKMALDPVIDLIKKDLNKMTASERTFILDLVEDVKGRYTIGNKIVDGLFRTYGGYNRFVGKARKLEAQIKLGYRPVAASINLASGQMHTWIKVGAPIYARSIAFLKTAEGKALINEVKQFLGTTLASGEEIHTKTALWKPLGLFQAAEPYNREVSVAANYLYAKEKLGMTEEAAKESAIRSNWAQQFTYNIANLPKLMRGPTGRLLTQFKPYLVKEIEFMSNLSPKEWTRYLAMQLALGGPRGYLMVMKSLPILAGLGFWSGALDDLEEWMNKNLPIASRGIAALPSLIKPGWGVDITAPATFQFPREPLDFAGPFLSDLAHLYNDVIEPISTYGMSFEDASKAIKPFVAAKYWSQVLKYAFSEDDWVKDSRGNKLYEVPEVLPFIMQSVAGVENVDLARIKAEEGILARRSLRQTRLKTRLVNETMQLILDGKPIPTELIDQLVRNGVKKDSIMNRIKTSNLPPDLRAILRTEVNRRPEVMDMYPTLRDFD